MIPMEIIARGLQMERGQLRLGLVISLIVTINSVMLFSSMGAGAQYLISGSMFVSMLIVEYLLTKQSLQSSRKNVSVLHQLGAKNRSITISILARFLAFGSIGILGGYVVGVSAIVAFQTLSISYSVQAFNLIIIGIAGLVGIVIGSYFGIRTSIQTSDRDGISYIVRQ